MRLLSKEEIDGLIEERDMLAYENKACKEAISTVRGWYPEDIFPTTNIKQLKEMNYTKEQELYLTRATAKMARFTCDNILDEINKGKIK